MADATFHILGPVRVCGADGGQVHLTGMQRAVLAGLLLNVNTLVSRERLVETLWENPPASAVPNLQTYIAQLRKVLPPGTRLRTEGKRYLLEARVEEVDLLRFGEATRLARGAAEEGDLRTAVDHFEGALALWRGAPAEGTTLAGPMVARVAELEERLAAVRLDCAEVKLTLGRAAEVVPDLRLFVAEQPLRERAWRLLVLAHARAGHRDRALETFQQARTVLADQLGLEPGEDLQRAQLAVLAGTLPVNEPAPPAAAGRLPADVNHFTGREDELAALDGLLPAEPSRTTTTCVISGPGGVGKTSLAVHWAHRVRKRFPDGRLHVDLRGFSPVAAPMPPREAVRVLLGLLQVPHHRMPATFEEQLALYRSLLAGRRVLILLDNARDLEQVRPLLPPYPEALTLVTSRTGLTGLVAAEGAHLLRLAPLADGQAGRLLARRLGHERIEAERAAADDIIKACAGLPLALGVVAARAIFNAGLPLAALAEELRAETTRLDALQTDELSTDLREVFGSSYRVLAPEAARAFAHLGLAPGPDLGLAAAAALIGRPVARARTLLRTLESAHLLRQHVPGRYLTHDLIRLYAIERAERDLSARDRTAALGRLVDWYLHTSYAADRLLSPHRRGVVELAAADPGCPPQELPDAAAAQDWFRAEHACLLATQRLAAEHGFDVAAWQLAWTLDTFHLRHNLLESCVSTWRTAARALDHLPGPATHALVHQMLARACARAGHHEESLSHFAAALTRYEKSGDLAGQAHVHHALAIAWEDRRDHERALHHLEEALRLYDRLDEPVAQANALNTLGWNHALLADFAAARRHCERALVLQRRHGDRVGEAATLDSLGYVAHHTGDHARALGHFHEALTLRRENGNAGQEAETLSHLGETYHALGRYAEAARVWCRALAIYQDQHRTERARDVQARLAALPAEPG